MPSLSPILNHDETIRSLVPEDPKDVICLTHGQLQRIRSFAEGFQSDRELFIRVAPLTPALAQELIRAGYVPNRPLDWQLVKHYAEAIGRGEWLVNSESLKITHDGYLLDGRHRCCAVLLAERTIDTVISIGIDRACFDTLDQGKPRSMAAILHMGGEGDTKRLAATLRLLWSWENGYLVKGRFLRRPTARELEGILGRYGDNVRQAVRVASEYSGLMPAAPTAFLLYLFCQRDETLAREFFTKLKTGIGFTRPYDPVYTLREKIMAMRKLSMNRLSRSSIPVILAYATTAWNACRKHEDLRVLGNWNEQEFPVIV